MNEKILHSVYFYYNRFMVNQDWEKKNWEQLFMQYSTARCGEALSTRDFGVGVTILSYKATTEEGFFFNWYPSDVLNFIASRA